MPDVQVTESRERLFFGFLISRVFRFVPAASFQSARTLPNPSATFS